MSETAMPHDGRTRSKTHCPFDKISATFMEKQHLLHPVYHAENPARVLPCIPWKKRHAGCIRRENHRRITGIKFPREIPPPSRHMPLSSIEIGQKYRLRTAVRHTARKHPQKTATSEKSRIGILQALCRRHTSSIFNIGFTFFHQKKQNNISEKLLLQIMELCNYLQYLDANRNFVRKKANKYV